jgi:hypothetical protein
MNLYELQPGDKVRVGADIQAEVVKPTEDGRWILVKYLVAPGDQSLVGSQDLCAAEEITELLKS